MTDLEAKALAQYRPIGQLEDSGLELVQHVTDNTVAVRKHLTVYDRRIYDALLRRPVDHVPRILAMGEEDGVLTLVESYISGATLEDLIDRDGPMDPGRVLDLARSLCHILEQLHTRTPPVIHRDIKCANLLLDQSGSLWLLDLNAAKPYQPEQSRDTRLIGTQGYAAPEQYGFQSSGPATDLYAVGVVLNRLLTGAMPTEKRADGPLGRVIDRCLKVDPADRYPSAAAMLADLERVRVKGAVQPVGTSKSWIPPGFRTGTTWKMAAALLGYGLIFDLCLTMRFEEKLWPSRITVLGILLSWVALWTNYRGLGRWIWRAKTWWARLLIGLGLMSVIFFAWIVLLTIIS